MEFTLEVITSEEEEEIISAANLISMM